MKSGPLDGCERETGKAYRKGITVKKYMKTQANVVNSDIRHGTRECARENPS